MPQFSISISDLNMKQFALVSQALRDNLPEAREPSEPSDAADDGAAESAPAATPTGKRGRPAGSTKKKKDPEPEPEVDADEDAEVDDGLGFEDEAPEEEEAPVALDRDKDIIPAFQAFAKKYSREKAAAVLAKFKVKSVRDLPSDKFEQVLEVLKSGKI